MQPTWSADGRRLAFLALGVGDLRDAYVVDADGKNLRNVSNSPEDENRVAWSPDGTRLAYVRNPDTSNANAFFMVADADGSNARPVPGPPLSPDQLLWSPDGARLLGHGVRGSPPRVPMPTRTPSSSSTHPGACRRSRPKSHTSEPPPTSASPPERRLLAHGSGANMRADTLVSRLPSRDPLRSTASGARAAGRRALVDLDQAIERYHSALDRFGRGDPESLKALYSQQGDVTLR